MGQGQMRFPSFSTLQEVVDYISESLQCPVTIEDGAHRLLAYSKHDIQTDIARIETIITRQVPQKVIHSLWEKGIIQALNESDTPVHINSIDKVGLGSRIAISIRHQREILGYIWIVSIEGYNNAEAIEFLKAASEEVKRFLLELRHIHQVKTEKVQQFFQSLLTGAIPDANEVEAIRAQVNCSIPSHWSIAVFRFPEIVGQQIDRQLLQYFQSLNKKSVVFSCAIQEEVIVFLSGEISDMAENNAVLFMKDTIDTIEQRFQIKPIYAGYGRSYAGFENIKKSYQEARQIIKYKKLFPEELHEKYSYEGLGIYQYFDVILENRPSRLSSTVARLSDYDVKNQTDLLHSLEAFLSKDCNISEAAKLLHVHPNTLNYRMKRIVEITNIDLRNMNEKIALYIELKLRRVDGSFVNSNK
ncbi:PucR family transcriptional regulator [Bacillus alkalicellulosilyticus]|uniref:PucR family transcriptional regulator n=1 Tax=Alkalihalobacterium alkalicellulosilyticum TaxID=1912214 RepID=UPI00148248B4|nr:PucR family transcriptional regulator [Bacillus alkalicellulosilyticus]